MESLTPRHRRVRSGAAKHRRGPRWWRSAVLVGKGGRRAAHAEEPEPGSYAALTTTSAYGQGSEPAVAPLDDVVIPELVPPLPRRRVANPGPEAEGWEEAVDPGFDPYAVRTIDMFRRLDDILS
jgi:hypothetical protein